jgi:acetyltransferase-like isoleucine patch superfamily enzyme
MLSLIVNDRVRVHHSTRTGFHTRIQSIGGGKIKIGRHCNILDYASLITYGGNIEIGDNVSIHHNCMLNGTGGIKIGNDVRIAAHVVMLSADHVFKDRNVPIRLQEIELKEITVGDDVWIGANATILGGIDIGKGCVIGAGSVVTRSIPEYSVAVGVPARIICKRGE